MSDTLVLRKVYAVDSNTGIYISTAGQVLLTDAKGGTNWIPLISSIQFTGGDAVGILPSTLSTVSTTLWQNTSSISSINYILLNDNPGQITLNNLTSTTGGLGQIYTSTISLVSTTVGLNIQIPNNLGSAGYISSASLTSTVDGLGNLGYISTNNQDFESTTIGLGSAGYVSSLSLVSTVENLGTAGYLSTPSLYSTISSLGTIGYVSTSYLSFALTSTTRGLPIINFISTAALTSTVGGLGQRYISTASLVSTTSNLSSLVSRITFNNAGDVFVRGPSQIFFSSINYLTFVSTIQYSSISLAPPDGYSFTTTANAQIIGDSNLLFSTACFNLSSFSNYITGNSKISLDIYPNYLFSKLPDGATPAMLPISTLIQTGADYLSCVTTTYLYAKEQDYVNVTPSFTIPGRSNCFNQPIRLEITPSSIVGDFTSSCTLVHYMPGGYSFAPNNNALSNNQYKVYFGTPSAFLSVNNFPN